MRRVAIGYSKEDGHERAVCRAHRHVALVALHRSDEDPLGQSQVVPRDGPGDHARPLHEVHDLLKLVCGVAPRAPRRRSSGIQPIGNGGAPLHVVGEHRGAPKLLKV